MLSRCFFLVVSVRVFAVVNFSVCVSVCNMCTVPLETRRHQDPLKLELEMVVNYPV